MELNPQRFELQLLDAVVLLDDERGVFAGYHDLSPDAWWARGHIPGRPLFPGVLMIESAAQLAGFAYQRRFKSGRFLGFAGVDSVKFRDTIVPPARFVVVGKALEHKTRRTITQAQGFVGTTMVFEAVITGMPV
ncbi:3-hydroxyacyl-[acyl-carrier-protein] dehydratase FabZ [Phycisphaerae bacterium RAS1]|nr:3-hydroxyacyl-[acyl-carrier-protein] dehydratase FabZ [Phycisphaerae bacterium RAS1]